MNKLFLCGVLVILTVSCSHKKEKVNGKANNYFESIQKTQRFWINPTEDNIVLGKNNTKIQISKNSFNTSNDSVVVELIECYSLKDIIFNNLSTVTEDEKLLETDGMLYVEVKSTKGEKLRLNKPITINIPSLRKKGLEKFELFQGKNNTNQTITWRELNQGITSELDLHGKEIEPDSSDTDLDFDSLQAKPSTTKVYIKLDSSVKNKYIVGYIFQISSLGWINSDCYVLGEAKNVIVNLADSKTYIKYYLVLKKSNSVVIGSQDFKNNTVIFKNIPISEPFTIVGFGMQDENLYFKMIDYSSSSLKLNFPSLQKTDRDELIDLLMKKFGKNIWNRPNA